MKISIIIPVYNGEKFLNRTIQSLLLQPYKEIELILVNDGSTDSSLDICKNFARSDSRIILIDKENGGISSARNEGLKYASGEWISFIDQDDEITNDIYLKLGCANNLSVDMVVSGKTMLLIDGLSNIIQKRCYSYSDEIVVDQTVKYKYLLNINNDTRLLHLWNCLYKKSIIENYGISFNENLKYGHEDSLFNFEYVTKCYSIQFVSGIVYTYSRRTASSTSLKSNKDYISDYQIYCETVENCMPIVKEEDKRIFFTYLFRLGINLYKQYGCKENWNDLMIIYLKASRSANSNCVSIKGVSNCKLYFFYKACEILLKNNFVKLCSRLVLGVTKK